MFTDSELRVPITKDLKHNFQQCCGLELKPMSVVARDLINSYIKEMRLCQVWPNNYEQVEHNKVVNESAKKVAQPFYRGKFKG